MILTNADRLLVYAAHTQKEHMKWTSLFVLNICRQRYAFPTNGIQQ